MLYISSPHFIHYSRTECVELAKQMCSCKSFWWHVLPRVFTPLGAQKKGMNRSDRSLQRRYWKNTKSATAKMFDYGEGTKPTSDNQIISKVCSVLSLGFFCRLTLLEEMWYHDARVYFIHLCFLSWQPLRLFICVAQLLSFFLLHRCHLLVYSL